MPLEQLGARLFVQASARPSCLSIVENIAAARQVADQHALVVAHGLRTDVLIGRGILHDRAHVHAALVGKRAAPNERLIVAQRQVGPLRDEPARRRKAGQFLRPHRGVSQFDFKVGDDGGQVGVPAALAIAVQAALHVRGAYLDRGDGVGHRHVRIVVRVDARRRHRIACAQRPRSPQPPRDHAAVGIAQAQHVRAGLVRRRQRFERVLRLGDVAVEEMFGIVDHFLAVVLEVFSRFRK